jgi:hypothetical protein
VSGGETLGTRLGYIIRILQHFATKLWNITNLVMLFQAVMKFLSRLVEFKILVNWGLVHSNCVFLHSSTAVLAIFGGKRQLPPIMPPKIKLSAAIFGRRRIFVLLMMLHCLLNSINSSKYEHMIRK